MGEPKLGDDIAGPPVRRGSIARIWRGATPRSKADEYLEYLKKTGIKEYRSVKGNVGVLVLRRFQGDRAEFLLLTVWDSLDAIRAFAGPDPDRAVYYPADAEFLLELEETVSHYDVLLSETADLSASASSTRSGPRRSRRSRSSGSAAAPGSRTRSPC